MKKLTIEQRDEILKSLEGNSTHGNCCTCTKCKNYHDECMCYAIEILGKFLNDNTEQEETETNITP